MSLANIYLTAREATIITDTAQYDVREGWAKARTVGYCDKVITFPRLKAAAVLRGWTGFLPMIGIMVNQAQIEPASFDGMLPLLREIIEKASDVSRGSLVAEKAIFEIYFVGWSDAANRVVAVISAKGMEGYLEDFELNHLRDGLTMEPGYPELVPKYGNQTAEGQYVFRKLDLGKQIAIAKRQRELAVAHRGFAYIDGQLVVTTISRNGIEQRPVYAWPKGA